MGYRGRKRRLKNFAKNAREFMRHFRKKPFVQIETHSSRTLKRPITKQFSGTRQRIIIDSHAHGLKQALLRQKMLMDGIKLGKIKPKYFSYVPFNAEITLDHQQIIQEYFHKPNAEQVISFLRAAKEKRRAIRYRFELNPEEYELCKKFLKNRVNKGITIEQVEKASKELMKSVGFKRNDFDAHKHNVLVQGINRDGKLRLTLIDM